MKRYFITGTDTEVGKTYVSKLLLEYWNRQGLKTVGYKPVAAGAELTAEGLRNEDALVLQQAASIKMPYEKINPFCFTEPCSPHIAASIDNQSVSVDDLVTHYSSLNSGADIELYEGAGGWFCPINETETLADFAKAMDFEVIVVVGLKLGCLNHAILSAEVIQTSGVNFSGWIGNAGPEKTMNFFEENLSYLAKTMPVPLIAMVQQKDMRITIF